MSKKEYRRTPEFIEIRLNDVKADTPGSRSEGFTIASTLLDVKEHPGAWLGSMYEGRWIVEPDIKLIKCTLGLEHLRGQSPESLHRELWTGVLTYNLVRLKMLQSGYAAGREIRSMSFTETHQRWRQTGCFPRAPASAKRWQSQRNSRVRALSSVSVQTALNLGKTNGVPRF